MLLREEFLTPQPPTPDDTALFAKDFLSRVANEFSPTARVVGVGIAIPGVVDERTDTVRVAPHLNWVDVPLVSLIEEALALPVHMANDATLGVMAESMFGAGVGSDDVVYLNGSTSGLGGGVVTGGHIVTGVRGFGAELGHILIDPCGTVCGCGRTGCLETEVNIQRVWAAAGQGHVPIDELDHLYSDHSSAARGAAELAFGPLLADPVNTPLFEVGSLKSVAN